MQSSHSLCSRFYRWAERSDSRCQACIDVRATELRPQGRLFKRKDRPVPKNINLQTRGIRSRGQTWVRLLHNRRLIDELAKPDLRSIGRSVDAIASACSNGMPKLEISAPGEHDDYVGAVRCGRRVFATRAGPGDSAAECDLQTASSIL